MSTIPYHQAKELLEKGVAEYIENFERIELPPLDPLSLELHVFSRNKSTKSIYSFPPVLYFF